MRLVRAAAQMAARLPRIPLDPETLDMLQRGNTAPADAVVDALGRKPRPVVPLAIEASAGRPGAVADWARLNAMLPLLRWSIGLMWILTGVVSLGLYPVERSYALLASVGIGAAMAPLFLYGAALLDLALGIAVFVLRRRLWLWRFQIALIIGYTLIISVALPEFWLHPFGPVLKNVPLLAAILALHELERRA
jgi:hypothetical protein